MNIIVFLLCGQRVWHWPDAAMAVEIDLADVGAVDVAAFERWMAHALVVKQGLHGGGIPLVKRLVTEASGMETEGEPARAGEEFDGLKWLHGF
jgi:hypothetical protein